MSDCNVTRKVATKITDRFSITLRNLEDDIVVCSLMKYYKLCSIPVKDEGGMDMGVDEDLLWAIERVLEDFMCTADYSDWLLTRKGETDE